MTCAAETDLRANCLRDWQLATLKELVEIGMALARELPAKTAAAPAPSKGQGANLGGAAPDRMLAFSRLSRSIRLTLGLQTRILEGPKDKPEPRVSEPEARAPEPETLPEPLADADLEDRRTTGRLRRSMAGYIAQTAIKALEREAPETERLVSALEARLDREDEDDADFAEIEVKALALAVCRDLGVDPGPDWWLDGWGIDSNHPPLKAAAFGGGGDERQPAQRAGCDRQRFGDRHEERLSEAEAGPNGGGGGKESLLASGAASALQPQIIRTG